MSKPKKRKYNNHSPKVELHKLDTLEWISIALCMWFLIFPEPYPLIFTAVLALPIIGLIINGLTRPSLASLVSISDQHGEDKYDLADFIEFPGIVILIRVLRDFEFESFYSILKVGTIGFIILLLLLVSTHKLVQRSNKKKWLVYLSVVGNIFLYSYAATYGVNCVYDSSDPQVFEAKVVDKRISSTSKSRTYYIEVEPWGHHKDREEIPVSISKYAVIEIGETVSIDYKKGALGIPWYYIE